MINYIEQLMIERDQLERFMSSSEALKTHRNIERLYELNYCIQWELI